MKIDFHTHIMPALDHGSDSVETSLAQLELMKRSGVAQVVSTSHFYPHRHSIDFFLEERAKAAERLTSRLDGSEPKIVLGAEVLLCDNIHKMPGLEKLVIDGTNCILLELPFAGCKHEHFVSIEAIRDTLGLVPVLAHIDRYPKENMARIFSRGLYFQMNAPAFLSIFGSKKYFEYAEMETAVAIGSDIHGLDGYVEFDRACKKLEAKGLYEPLMERSKTLLKGAKFIN